MTEELDLYEHVKRPEWGLSEIVIFHTDRMTFGFIDGVERTIKREHVHLMKRVVLTGEEADEARKKLHVHARKRARSLAKTKPRVKKKPAARPAAAPPAAH